MVTAGEGKGKSLLLLQTAVMIASGLHPFRATEIDPARVLVLDFENDPEEVQDRLRQLAAVAGDLDGFSLEVRPQGVDLRRPADRRWVEAKVAAARPALLIVGPVYNMLEPDDRMRSDSAEAALVVARFLSQIRVRYDCAVILEAHAPHGDKGDRAGFRPFGSTVWMRWVNVGLGLASKDSGDREEFQLISWKQSRSKGRDWPRWLTRSTVTPWPWEAKYA
jgi:replicative DNA helicase